ncbi:MAG: hypothetical protein KGL10_08405 [Alphaproteobacteria bacterium]|nr:hypothetical protein [Alphaproteobacteria bacterium]MDE2337320.1 hypothetical protein [Alphaproteobacteria bacterium]
MRTYIKLKITHTLGAIPRDVDGGVYFDAVTGVEEWRKGRSTILHYAGQSTHSMVTVNKPLAEVEEMLAAAQAKRVRELDWRDISGIPLPPPEPPRPPKEKKSLAQRFGLR